MSDFNHLDKFIDLMWKDYCQMNPQAQQIYNAFESQGEIVKNDHIALRTVNHPLLGIKSLSCFFEKYGYVNKGEYFFKEKKLYAQHFEHSDQNRFPKIFISELELEKMSPYVQGLFSEIVPQIKESNKELESFVYSGKHWSISYDVYQKLAQESEYASWVYAFGFRPNHFTVNVNNLKKFTEVTAVNEFIKSMGIKLNVSGGEIKGTVKDLLEQSSTMANKIKVHFSEGDFEIPACYYEFAKRYKMPSGEFYQGFVAQSADKIFESTNNH